MASTTAVKQDLVARRSLELGRSREEDLAARCFGASDNALVATETATADQGTPCHSSPATVARNPYQTKNH